MSTIFTNVITTQVASKPTIRIHLPNQTGVPYEEWKYQSVPLLEYHPDYDTRMKFRGYAHIPYDASLVGYYDLQGLGYLDKPYLYVREFNIHRDDVRELMTYCTKVLKGGPLIVEACPLPFPMFQAGQRVQLMKEDERCNDVGALGTCIEDSSMGAMTAVHFDIEALNKGYKSMGMHSLNLRLYEEV